MNASTIRSVTQDMDAVKRDMEMKILSTIIKQKIKKINNAHQRIVAREKRVFMEAIGIIDWSWNDQRVYMEGRKGYIRKETLLEKAKIIRSIYLKWLRSVSITAMKIDRTIWKVLYAQALTFKKHILKGLEDGSREFSDKEVRYMNMVIGTLNKYTSEYLNVKTSISVEILRAIRCKYMDRVIMGFL